MIKRIVGSITVMMVLVLGCGLGPAGADDLDDGICSYTDENIAADDGIGSNRDNNINFIVVDAINKAKTKRTKDGSDKAEDASDSDEISNVYGEDSEHNENSVVVGAGSRVDKIYNIVIEK